MTNTASGAKVAVLGAAGGIGQPLSLLLKTNPLVADLALYDIVNTPGVAADLAHINTRARVTGYKGDDQLAAAVRDAHIVVIPAGVPRKPGMTRDDLYGINAGIVKTLVTACAKNCPKALICIISNPVNSTVPIAAEILKAHNVFDPSRLFGVTTLDIVRAATFVSELRGDASLANSTNVSVVGGHSGQTIVPLLSQLKGLSASEEEIKALTHRIQYGGDEVVKAKDGAGSATLSMAYAGARFVNALLDATVAKKEGVKECAYVYNETVGKELGVEYFSSVVEFGPDGIKKIHGIGTLSAYEKELLGACVDELKKNIEKGVAFVKGASL